ISHAVRDCYDYFRAILRKDERSERAFELTADAAALNPANYTVWHFRRILLKDLGKNLQDELDYITEVIHDHPKNYQVWHHRRVVVDWLRNASDEIDFTRLILTHDAKNYHAWQHRQWVLREFDLWDAELDYIDDLLEEDIRNNSAWNQRYYVISKTSKFTDEVIAREVSYTKEKINNVPNNESAWNYLRGVLLDTEMYKYSGLMTFCEELFSQSIRSPHLLAFMVDCYQEMLNAKCEDKEEVLAKALKLLKGLEEEYDTIRCEYWKYLSVTLSSKYAGKLEQSSS
ncbi:hypothetical protein CAPTEDRAFT_104214, partial [Capitella teleta]